MTKIYNRTSEKKLRQVLRRNTPKAEMLLWTKLRRKQILGLRFRRQFSVGPYCVDFYCPVLKLAIEIDGSSHFSQNAMACDRDRQEYIESFDIRFLRFTNASPRKVGRCYRVDHSNGVIVEPRAFYLHVAVQGELKKESITLEDLKSKLAELNTRIRTLLERL